MKLNYFFLHNLIIYLIQSIMMEKLIFLQNSFCFINQSQKSILIYISVPHLKQFNIILKKWISYLIFHPKCDFFFKEFFLNLLINFLSTMIMMQIYAITILAILILQKISAIFCSSIRSTNHSAIINFKIS